MQRIWRTLGWHMARMAPELSKYWNLFRKDWKIDSSLSIAQIDAILSGCLMARVLSILRFTLHTHPRGLTGAPKPPQLGSMSGLTGQAAQSTRLDDPRPSGPPARPSPASGTHRGGTTVSAASSPASPCCCRALPFGSHRKHLPWQLLIASCHARGAA